MKIAFYTLGCKVNTYETESVWEQFKEEGYERVDSKEFADVYVINTCTVTNNGDVKSRKAIRQLIKKNPEAVVAVMGCYAQMSPEDIVEIDGVTKTRIEHFGYGLPMFAHCLQTWDKAGMIKTGKVN